MLRSALARRAIAFLVVVLAAGIASASAGSTGLHTLPPGMTPQLMRMMMQPGPAHPAGIPAAAVPVGGCIPTMGYHYVRPTDAPLGPFYGWYGGRPIFTEIMVDAKTLGAGRDWNEQLRPLPGYAIDHVDVWYEPHGHPGYTVPHYDIHAWYVPHAAHMRYCGNTSGRRPTFL